jgi:hypothetical protein
MQGSAAAFANTDCATGIECWRWDTIDTGMSEIQVTCYAGRCADERPTRFAMGGREFTVRGVDGQWHSPDATYFRVLADDGNYYVLRHDKGQNSWTLDGFRAARQN